MYTDTLTVSVIGKAVILIAIPVSIAAFNKREISACIRICNVYKVLCYGRHTVDGIVAVIGIQLSRGASARIRGCP